MTQPIERVAHCRLDNPIRFTARVTLRFLHHRIENDQDLKPAFAAWRAALSANRLGGGARIPPLFLLLDILSLFSSSLMEGYLPHVAVCWRMNRWRATKLNVRRCVQ
jgi:hypothetical protein